MPAYNVEKYIEESISSILNQTYSNWELILIDDGSIDNTVEIINKYKNGKNIFLLQHPGGVNLGVSKSRELGIKFAKGEYIAFLDSDDVFYPEKLSNQLKIFLKSKDIILIHSKVEILNNFEITFNNEFILDRQDKVYRIHEEDNWLIDNRICNSTVIVKSKVLKEIQFGLTQLFQYEDWLLWSLIAEKGKFYYQNEPQVKYRIHPMSATASILKNKLISPYSKIEYLISLYLLNDTSNFNYKIINQLKESMIYLLKIYSNENADKVNCFRSGIYEFNSNEEMYIKEIDELTRKHFKLQKECEELHNVKKKIIIKELIIRILSKIKKLFK